MLHRGKRGCNLSVGFAKGNMKMPVPNSTNDPIRPDGAHAAAEPARREEPMDDEEKVIANRPDANMPALLTRDVLGG